jgi:hypothetical protein
MAELLKSCSHREPHSEQRTWSAPGGAFCCTQQATTCPRLSDCPRRERLWGTFMGSWASRYPRQIAAPFGASNIVGRVECPRLKPSQIWDKDLLAKDHGKLALMTLAAGRRAHNESCRTACNAAGDGRAEMGLPCQGMAVLYIRYYEWRAKKPT